MCLKDLNILAEGDKMYKLCADFLEFSTKHL